MKTAIWLWIVALIVTLVSARYQRVTGPTWPLSGTVTIGAEAVPYRLERTHAGADDHRVAIVVRDAAVNGVVEWRDASDAGAWQPVVMTREGATLAAALPGQPRGGRLHYRVRLMAGDRDVVIPGEAGALLRFRDPVPLGVLIPHVIAMFGAMLVSTRAGLEALRRDARLKPLAQSTVALLFVGGIVLGCLVSWYAFRAPWTGFPVGRDITDSKTLIALLGWVAALFALGGARRARAWVFGASLLTLLVFLIPHSAG